MEPQAHQLKPLNSKEDRTKSAADRNAIKANYKTLAPTLMAQDLVSHIKTCYNTYQEASEDIATPKDIRMSYHDRAIAYKQILDYITRQQA